MKTEEQIKEQIARLSRDIPNLKSRASRAEQNNQYVTVSDTFVDMAIVQACIDILKWVLEDPQ